MVTGVNSNYYNYYNNYQNQYGNYGQPTPAFTANPATSPQQSATLPKTSADGKDDGHISLLSKLKNLGKGAIKFVTGMFTDENGSFSLGQTLKTLAIAGSIGAICVLTAGTAVPALIAAAGVTVSGLGVARAGLQAALADSDAEAEQAWQSLGSNGVALGLSVAGAKAVAKSSPAHAAELKAGKFKGAEGIWNSVKTVYKDSWKPVNESFKGVSDAYKGATGWDKVSKSWNVFKDNVGGQYKGFKTQVKTNVNNALYGTTTKVDNEIAELNKEKTSLEKQMKSMKDKTSPQYKALENKVKVIEAKREGMREINTATSVEDANGKINVTKDAIRTKKAELKNATTDAEKASINNKIAELEAKLEEQNNVLTRRASEVRALDKRISDITEELNKEGLTDAKIAELRADLKYLQDQRTAANFELPKQASVDKAKTASEEAQTAYESKVEAHKTAQEKYTTEQTEANKQALEQAKTDVEDAKTALNEAQNEYNMLSEMSKPGGYKTHAMTEISRATKDELFKGTIKDNFLNQTNPAQWLTVGVAGRQFGETQEYRFYSQLSPQEQLAYKNIPYQQKQALINTYTQMT